MVLVHFACGHLDDAKDREKKCVMIECTCQQSGEAWGPCCCDFRFRMVGYSEVDIFIGFVSDTVHDHHHPPSLPLQSYIVNPDTRYPTSHAHDARHRPAAFSYLLHPTKSTLPRFSFRLLKPHT